LLAKLETGEEALLELMACRKSLIELKTIAILGYKLPSAAESLKLTPQLGFFSVNLTAGTPPACCLFGGNMAHQYGYVEVIRVLCFVENGRTHSSLRRAVIARPKVQVSSRLLTAAMRYSKVTSHSGADFDALPIISLRNP
jgi:hypothetical protein